MKKIFVMMLFVSCNVNAEPITVVGALSIASSLYTLSKAEFDSDKKVVKQETKENTPANYHFENTYDENCNCIKKIIVKSLNEEALY